MAQNGTNGSSAHDVASVSRFDPTFTQRVVDSMGPNTSPRIREVMSKLIPHMHDFAREVELTWDEWMTGLELLNRAGKMSNATRNEGQLVCDVLGFESLMVEIAYTQAAKATDVATQAAVLGPFFRDDHPLRKNGSSIYLTKAENAEEVFLHGRVMDAQTGQPLANATVDTWMASTNGLYEQQDENQLEHNLGGKFITDSNGEYSFYTIRPTPYPIPYDGPSGDILQAMDRHPYRPAHIHLIILKEGYKPITTQIFDKESKYLDNDSVFAVQHSLIVEFKPRAGDPNAKLELQYDIRMAPMAEG